MRPQSSYVNRQQKASAVPNVLDIAWAAGIFEGEGGISGRAGNGKVMSVTQKDPWLLLRLQRLFGGTVRQYVGYWRWFASGSRARGFAMTIFAFLSPRRKEQVGEVIRSKTSGTAASSQIITAGINAAASAKG